MINKNNLERARHIKRCADGSSITRSLGNSYAKKMGLNYDPTSGVFTNPKELDANGKPQVVNVSSDQLAQFKSDQASSHSAMGSALSQMGTMGSAMLAGSPNIQNQSAEVQAANAAFDTAADVVSKVSPLAGGIMKAGGFAADALTAAGIGTDQVTGVDKALDSKFLKLTPVGLINAIGASNLNEFSVDQEAAEKVGGSYGGVLQEAQDATKIAGKKVGFFSNKKKLNGQIEQARDRMNKMSKIADEVTEQRASVAAMGDVASDSFQFQTSGGFDARRMRASAKQGGTLREEFVPEIIHEVPQFEKIVPSAGEGGVLLNEKINPTSGQIEPWTPELVTVDSLKTGGKVEKQLDAPEIPESSQKNLIPEGALHKNKHHMENAEDLTKKGIPVVDNEHQQQAEIECNEIIFNKEVTSKLEELYKKYYAEDTKQSEKDDLAITAGKLLTKEIMLNTDDRTGLIDTLQQGGTLEKDKPDYETWLASVPAKSLSDNYDLETAYKVLPFSKLERWRLEVLKEKPSDSDEWHLPSVYQFDEDTYIWLKRGKTAKQNPELQGELDFYTTDPEFSKTWKMKFDKDNNRWTYVRRKKEKSEE